MQANLASTGDIAIDGIRGHGATVLQPYESLEAELYDAFQQPHGPSPELALMKSFLESHAGPALEVGCGCARLLLPLIEAGYEVEGLELSKDMLELAEKRARSNGVETSLHQGDMNTWSPKQPYSSLLVPAFTLQLADEPLATLHHWRSWLQAGGGIYLTTFMPYGELLGELPADEWYLDHQATLPSGEHAVLETRHELDIEQGKLVRHHRYRIEGRPDACHESCQTLHWAEPAQWRDWLEAANFEVDAQFLDWDESYVDDAPNPEEHLGIITTLGIAINP